MLVAACERSPDPPPVRHRIDASVRVDAPSLAVRADAAAQDAAIDAAASRSLITVYVVGGGGLVREGAPVQIRVVRRGGAGGRAVEVTGAAAVRVDPPDRGAIDAAKVFRGRGRGRVQIVATQGGDEARTTVDVSDELPAGTNVIPTLQASGGLVALSVRFEARMDGTTRTRLEFLHRSLALEGRRMGRVFPITVPVRDDYFSGDSPGASPVTGVIVLDRWAAGRLDAHGTLRIDDRPVQIRFTAMVPDMSALACDPALGAADGGVRDSRPLDGGRSGVGAPDG